MTGTPAKNPTLAEVNAKKREEEEAKKVQEAAAQENKKKEEDEAAKEKTEEEFQSAPKKGEILSGGNVIAEVKEGIDKQADSKVINRTPAQLAHETPAETAKRYGISSDIPEDVHNDPNVLTTRDNTDFQIPGGTHLHPDIAADNYNRNVGTFTERAQVSTSSNKRVYAAEAAFDDKGRKDVTH